MRRFVTTIIILILSIFLAISFNNEANSFSPGYDDYHIIQSYETVYDDDCKNIQIRIVDNKEVKVCVISTSDPEVGIITEGINNQTIGVSFNNDLSMTRVYMDYSPFKCDSVCLYLNQIDTLIRLENVNGGNWYSLVYYKNFVKNLKLSNTNGENIFDYTNKNREIIRPYPTTLMVLV